jgi:hypothetical protein
VTPSKQQRQRRKQLHWQVIRKIPKQSVWKQLPAGSPLGPGAGPARPGLSPSSLEALFTVVDQVHGAALQRAKPKRVALLSLARAHNICIRLAGGGTAAARIACSCCLSCRADKSLGVWMPCIVR